MIDPTAGIEAKLRLWLAEGFTSEDILAQARHNWPDLPTTEIQARLNNVIVQKHDNLAPHVLVKLVQQKRMRELERLEARLDDEACPLSVHTLYRGLLRDIEAHCFKTLANERQLQLDVEKQATTGTHRQFKLDLDQARRHEQLRKQMGSQDSYDDEDDEDELDQKAGKSFTSFSTLLGMIFAVLLSSYGCMKLPAPTHDQCLSVSHAMPTNVLSTPDLTQHSQCSPFPSPDDFPLVQSRHRKPNPREKDHRC